MLEVTFWICVVAATYSYFWYPTFLLILPSRENWKLHEQPNIRKAAIIIAARNEAGKIVGKIQNTLALDRSGFELDVIVASDASEDATDSLVRESENRGVRLVRSNERHGKEHAQGLAVRSTDADVIVFTDAATILPEDALIRVIEAFRDSSVGAISSVDQFLTADGSLQGEGAYVRYEMWLRDLETRFFSLVGLSGSFFAARRSVCQNWDERIPSDFGTALNCVQLGMRAISDRRVIGFYKNIAHPQQEYSRKIRTVVRGMNALFVRREVLDFVRYGRFSFQIVSHKLMRWATPWFLLAALGISGVLAARHPLFEALAFVQFTFYLAPLVCSAFPTLLNFWIIRLAAYFVEVNAAILHATVLALSGRTFITWEPSRR